MRKKDDLQSVNAPEEKNNTFTYLDEEGQEVECDIILSVYNEERQKRYIIYTDRKEDEDGDLMVYAAIHDPEDEKVLLPIESDEEWAFIEQIMAEAAKECED